MASPETPYAVGAASSFANVTPSVFGTISEKTSTSSVNTSENTQSVLAPKTST